MENNIFYHGSPHKIGKFTDEFVGGKEANDQEGPGIYFTSSWKNARSYGGYIYTVKLNPRKAVSIQNGKKASVKELTWLIKQAPGWEETAQNWNENPMLGLKQVVSDTLKYNDNPHQQFQQVWVDFYRYKPVEYVKNMVKLGYDLIYIPDRKSMISGEDNITHVVVLNPAIIEFVDMKDDRTEEEKGEIKEINNTTTKYVYHGTSKGAAYRIQRKGKMSPGQASGTPNAPLFFSNQEQYASTYASRKDFSGGVLLRLKRTPDMKVATNISNKNGYIEYYTFREIPSQEIEVKSGDKWISISKFSFINENTLRTLIKNELKKIIN